MAKLPVTLTTAYGIEQFNILATQHDFYKKAGESDSFRERCKGDFEIQNNYLVNFLDDDAMAIKYKMEDDPTSEGNMIFNKQSDVCSCLIHFGQEWK